MLDNNTPFRSLTLQFDLDIYPRQIKNWRGAFLQMAGWQDELFHNHANSQEANNYHYRYPLIHYRYEKGKAAIFAINEGVAALQKVLAQNNWEIEWQGEKKTLQIEDLRMNEHYFRMLNDPKEYRLYKWLALNQENYARWQHCRNLKERIALLERILGSNIISLFKGLNWRPDERIEVNIQEIRNSQMVQFHGQKLLALDIIYDANVLLPAGIGIGKGVSLGFGWQMPRKTRHHRTYKKLQDTNHADSLKIEN